MAAELTPANVADNEEAPRLLPELPAELRFLLGDLHYNDPALRARWATDGRELVATQRGPYPHTDDGVEVRRLRNGDYRQVLVEATGAEPAIVQAPVVVICTSAFWRNTML